MADETPGPYRHQEYPKHQYHKDGRWCICLTAADDKAIGKEWTDHKPANLNAKATVLGDIVKAKKGNGGD